MKIKVARSPDSDDAFMLYAIENNKISTGSYQIEVVAEDIEILNKKAKLAEYDVTAASFHCFFYLQEIYELMRSGASFGDNYGPTLICDSSVENTDILLEKVVSGQETILIPGELTSANLALKTFAPNIVTLSMPFNEIQRNIKNKKYKVGLLIHEGQIVYEREGFKKLLNLGEWWFKKTSGLPLPLGANIIRKSLSPEIKHDLNSILEQSILYAFENKKSAIKYASKFANGLQERDIEKFIDMFVNNLSLNCLEGRAKMAIREFHSSFLNYKINK